MGHFIVWTMNTQRNEKYLSSDHNRLDSMPARFCKHVYEFCDACNLVKTLFEDMEFFHAHPKKSFNKVNSADTLD